MQSEYKEEIFYWNDDLSHSAKGSTWKKHKYVRKEGNKYIYANDQRKRGSSLDDAAAWIKEKLGGNAYDELYEFYKNGYLKSEQARQEGRISAEQMLRQYYALQDLWNNYGSTPIGKIHKTVWDTSMKVSDWLYDAKTAIRSKAKPYKPAKTTSAKPRKKSTATSSGGVKKRGDGGLPKVGNK